MLLTDMGLISFHSTTAPGLSSLKHNKKKNPAFLPIPVSFFDSYRVTEISNVFLKKEQKIGCNDDTVFSVEGILWEITQQVNTKMVGSFPHWEQTFPM